MSSSTRAEVADSSRPAAPGTFEKLHVDAAQRQAGMPRTDPWAVR
jgi:hypothetical protein